jgi:DNA (cytosine-5)-methyltransferase 1
MAYTLDLASGQAVAAVDCRNLCENEELSGTLQSKSAGGYSLNYQNPVRVGYAVRRLTPIECLRLQGLPVWWFDDIPGNSDTACYKAAGNGMAQPCPDYVIENIAAVLKRDSINLKLVKAGA